MGATVVGKAAAAVITSSPGRSWRAPSLGEVSVVTATRLAEEPEFTINTSLTPRYSARRPSKSWEKRPAVSQKSSTASAALRNSGGPNTRPA